MSVAANRYAKALIDVLYPSVAEQGYEQLQRVAELLQSEPDARRLFQNPTVPSEKRKALLKEIGDALGLIPPIQNFVEILIEKNRLDVFDEIIKAYQKAMDERMGVVRASVCTAQPMDSVQTRELAAKLEQMTGKRVKMEVSVDPALLGGVVARVGSSIYDGSLRQQLRAFKSSIVQD